MAETYDAASRIAMLMHGLSSGAMLETMSVAERGDKEVEVLLAFVDDIERIADNFVPGSDAEAAMALEEMRDALKEKLEEVREAMAALNPADPDEAPRGPGM